MDSAIPTATSNMPKVENMYLEISSFLLIRFAKIGNFQYICPLFRCARMYAGD